MIDRPHPMQQRRFQATDDPSYQLNPRLRLTAYAGQYYAHDAALDREPMVQIVTETISAADFITLRALKGQGAFIKPERISYLRAALVEFGADAQMLERWIGAQFLIPYASPSERVQARMLQRLTAEFGTAPVRKEFTEHETNHRVFAPNSFFNLPGDIDPSLVQVGLVGVPFASLPVSAGTQVAPNALRLHSRAISWLDFQKRGAYSDMVLCDGRPEVIGQGVVLQDCGDLESGDASAVGLFSAIENCLGRLGEHGIRPLFIGGDHAVTYPIVTAMLAKEPRLGLLHFDAHNDLFYQGEVTFNHAAFLSNLVKETEIQHVVSFGLRTALDQRTQTMEQAYARDGVDDRVRLVPMTRLRQLLASDDALEEVIAQLAGRPYYLSLDLDVMSESAVSGQVSTPSGAGLEWHELHTLLNAVFAGLDIRGADVVEFNPGNGTGGAGQAINAVLVRIIDGLARSGGKPGAAPDQESEDEPTNRC